eukprot:7709535-Pyramimonas_sp.AAC.1
MNKTLNETPSKSTPIIGLDLNDHYGQDGLLPAAPSNVIGDAGSTGLPGEAAVAFHNMLDVHGMCIQNTFWNAGPTYFGTQGQATRPYFIAVPQGL